MDNFDLRKYLAEGKLHEAISLDVLPKNNIGIKVLINNIFAYSPKKNKANPIAEYSTL